MQLTNKADLAQAINPYADGVVMADPSNAHLLTSSDERLFQCTDIPSYTRLYKQNTCIYRSFGPMTNYEIVLENV